MKKRLGRFRYAFLGAILLSIVGFSVVYFLKPLEYTVYNLSSSIIFGVWKSGFVFHSDEESKLAEDEAFVISQRSNEFQSAILLNKSFPRDAHVISNGVLIGRIIESGSRASTVELFSSLSSRVEGVFERSGIPVELKGMGAQILEARLPRGADVHEGDTLYYNTEARYGLGLVVKIHDIPSEPFLVVWIQSPINSYALEKVTVRQP